MHKRRSARCARAVYALRPGDIFRTVAVRKLRPACAADSEISQGGRLEKFRPLSVLFYRLRFCFAAFGFVLRIFGFCFAAFGFGLPSLNFSLPFRLRFKIKIFRFAESADSVKPLAISLVSPF